MSFDLPFLPTVSMTGATGASAGGDTAAPVAGSTTDKTTGNTAATGTTTGTGDFASLLSGSTANLNVAPNAAASTAPQAGGSQMIAPAVVPSITTFAITANTPLTMSVSATLLQVQLPAASNETVVTPVTMEAAGKATPPQATVPQKAPPAILPQPAVQPVMVATITPEAPTPANLSEGSATKTAKTEDNLPVPAQPPALPDAVLPVSAETTPAPAPVLVAMPASVATPAVTTPVLPEIQSEVKASAAPVAKTTEAKPAKGKTTDSQAEKAVVETDNSVPQAAPVTPDATILLAVMTPPVVSAPASQPVAAQTAKTGAPPAPSGKKPAAPQAPMPQAPMPQAPQDQAAEDAGANTAAATATAPKFASLLNAAPAPATNTAPAVAPNAQDDAQPAKTTASAPQTVPPVEAAPVQKPAVQAGQNQAPVQSVQAQSAQVQTTQAQATQAQTTQIQATQTAARKSAADPAENNTDIASPPVASAPSGFSLVSAPVATAGYTPAATPVAPATSLLSQTAVDNLNALSVQINRRNAEGATKFTMELHPADLGKVDVALSIGRDGKMTAHMTFDSDMTAATFSAHESDLRQQLRDTGLQLSDESLSFSTRQKTDAVAQAQGHAVNASARTADDSASGNSSQQQQNAFAQADSQQGQQRPHSQHLAQLARSQAAADQAAADADLEALNSAIDTSAARLNSRQSSSRLALDLSV